MKSIYKIGDLVYACIKGKAIPLRICNVYEGERVRQHLQELMQSGQVTYETIMSVFLARDNEGFENPVYMTIPDSWPGVATLAEVCLIVGKEISQLQYDQIIGRNNRACLFLESDLIDRQTYQEITLLSKDQDAS